jgi:signal peptidase II
MRKFRVLFFCLLVFVLIGCDRVTKDIAKQELQGKPPVSYFNDKLRFEFAENTGAFLSFGADWSDTKSLWVLTILPLIFLAVCFTFVMRKAGKLNGVEITAFTLIFSGGIGNLSDRVLFNRHVTDFINLGINNLRTGIFNVADVYVTTGTLLLLVWYLNKSLRQRQPVSQV